MKGSRIGPYELRKILGAGGFGTVWLVRGPNDASYAMKILHPNLIHVRGGAKRGPTVADRFVAEARMIQKLDYPGFVKIYDIIEALDDRVIAYVMEKLEGRDLTRVISKISLPALLEAIAQTAETLGVLHQHGIIHRDVKGANIFICNPVPGQTTHSVRLLDFGIAKELGTEAMLESTATGYFLGTVRSMAPECFRRWSEDSPLTGAVDQWSLGVTLFYFLSGKMPFGDGSLATLINQIETGSPRPLVIRHHYGLGAVPDDLEVIVNRCLSKAPEDRFWTMGDMADALRHAIGRLTGPKTDPTVFDPELSVTAVDPKSRAGQHLDEARKIAIGIARGNSSADPFGVTAIADDSERATQTNQRTPSAATNPAAPASPSLEPGPATQPSTAQSINPEPQLLKGPLVLKTTRSKRVEATVPEILGATTSKPTVSHPPSDDGLEQTFIPTKDSVHALEDTHKDGTADTRLEIIKRVQTHDQEQEASSPAPAEPQKPDASISSKRLGILILSLVGIALCVYLLVASRA